MNAGTLVGYAGALEDMLFWIENLQGAFGVRDQRYAGEYFYAYPDRVKLDYNSDLFWCTGGEWHLTEERVKDGVVFNHHTGSMPYVVHLPWSSRKRHYLEALASALQIDISRGSEIREQI